MNNFNNFKIGDIVLFSSNPVYFPWHKGKIVANNAEIYYISEVDENNNILDDRKLVTIDKDSKYIIKFKPGMEWCIGEKSDNIPGVNDYWESLSYDPYHQDDHVYDRNKISETINVKKVHKDSSEPSNEEYIEIPNVNEMFDNEMKWKRKIEKKLDDINDKLNKILLLQEISKYTVEKTLQYTNYLMEDIKNEELPLQKKLSSILGNEVEIDGEKVNINEYLLANMEEDIKAKVKDLVDILIYSKYGSITFYYDQIFNDIINEYQKDKVIDKEKIKLCIEIMNNYYDGVIGIDNLFNA